MLDFFLWSWWFDYDLKLEFSYYAVTPVRSIDNSDDWFPPKCNAVYDIIDG
jgi:hypothetical protein